MSTSTSTLPAIGMPTTGLMSDKSRRAPLGTDIFTPASRKAIETNLTKIELSPKSVRVS